MHARGRACYKQMGPYARRLALLAIAIVSALGFLYLPGINVESSRSDVGPGGAVTENARARVRPLSVQGLLKKLRMGYIFEDSKVSGKAEISDRPYWKWLPSAVADSRSSTKYKDAAVLSVMPSIVENGGTVSLEWKNIPDHNINRRNDYIGLFCPSTSPSNRYIDYWSTSELQRTYRMNSNGNGRANIILYNVRTDCEFRYFANDTYVELVAVSNKVTFIDGGEAPLHAHLAMTGDASEMRVQWTTGVEYTPTVEYGVCRKGHSDGHGRLDRISTGISRTYKASDMCGPPANLSAHFVHPGYMHDVLLTGLQPNTRYCYRYGSPGFRYSKEKSFTSAVAPGEEQPFKFVIYGDMDVSPPPGAETTAARVLSEIKNNGVSFVLHAGDLAYGSGYAYRWEEWLSLIERYSSLAPYMIAIGNHEQEHLVGGEKDPSHAPGNGFHPSWGNFGHDSGGECGVPVYNRFHMPESGNGNQPWWYSFEYGLVHFTILSSEHNFTHGSPQYTWLENDLKSVDHSRTPWLITILHRPVYSSVKIITDFEVTTRLRVALEELLYHNKVDLVITGHHHLYERSCPVYRQLCLDGAPTHVVVGGAGFELEEPGMWEFGWREYYESSHGYGRVSVVDRKSLLWEFVRNKDNTVADKVWLHH